MRPVAFGATLAVADAPTDGEGDAALGAPPQAAMTAVAPASLRNVRRSSSGVIFPSPLMPQGVYATTAEPLLSRYQSTSFRTSGSIVPGRADFGEERHRTLQVPHRLRSVGPRIVCVDRGRQWSQAKNISQNAATRSTVYILGAPVRKLRSRR